MTGSILLVTKLKGGAGATTIARELAIAATISGYRVGMIDLDGQGGITRWWNRRNVPTAQQDLPANTGINPDLLEIAVGDIPRRTKALRSSFDLIVINSPPTVHDAVRQVAAVSDLALVPTRPTTDDLDAVGPIVRLLRDTIDLGFVLTQVPGGGRSRDGAEAYELLAKLAPVFGRTSSRLDYPRAAATGSTAFEGRSPAADEVCALWNTLRDRLKFTASRRKPMASSRDRVTAAGGDHAA